MLEVIFYYGSNEGNPLYRAEFRGELPRIKDLVGYALTNRRFEGLVQNVAEDIKNIKPNGVILTFSDGACKEHRALAERILEIPNLDDLERMLAQ